MSIFSYFKNFFHPNANKDRKRRRTELNPDGASQFPKYRRVSSVFPKQYPQRIDDDIDHFQQVKQNRQNYNEILENFLMEQQNQQRKQFETINGDEEFSDEDDINTMRVPNISSQRSRPQPSSSGYSFSSHRQSSSSNTVPSSFNFAQNKYRPDSDVQFLSRRQVPKPRQVPELVPIARSIPSQNGVRPNGFGNVSQSQSRRSVLDFTNKNRAFNDSSTYKFNQSVLDRNHNLEVKNKYDSLLKSLIPRFAQKAYKQSNEVHVKRREEPIQTVDLSSDETETSAGGAVGGEPSSRYTRPYGSNIFEFKKPSAFVDLSDDEDSDPFMNVAPVTSTIAKKSESLSRTSSFRKNDSTSSVVPDVKPVNSLAEKQQSRNCLKHDVISSIVRKFQESQRKNDSQINDVSQTVSKLSLETAEQEKWQQRRIDLSITSLTKSIVLDEEEEVIDEFPPLTDQQLQIIRWGLQGSRSEIIVSKFNMNITRHDLNTLDGLNWLNDEVINFYMELLKERSEQCDHLPKVHVMNTFFVPKLLQQGHSGVRRWTRKVDIFAFDVIPVPVHVGGVHWCMSIIHMRDKTIKYYDSMGHPNYPVLEALKRYLHDESMDKKKTPYDTSDWTIECVRDCPQQRNGSDCGVFSCMFAEFISRDSKVTFEQEHMQYFRRKMVFEIASGRMVLGY